MNKAKLVYLVSVSQKGVVLPNVAYGEIFFFFMVKFLNNDFKS